MIRKVLFTLILLVGLWQFGCHAAVVEREIVFHNDTIRLAGTLTLPSAKGSYPVAVILSGTGPQNRDGEMAGHLMFKEISDFLVSRGIGVFRFDDRGVGGSSGNYDAATTADFAADGFAATRMLLKEKGVDPHKIGYVGHSEGAAAMSIAAANGAPVRFMVSMGGLCADGLHALIRQNEDLVASYPMEDYDRVRSNMVNNLMFRIAYRYADTDSLVGELNRGYEAWRGMDSIYVKAAGIEHDHFRFPIYMFVQQAQTPWYRFHVRYNPADYLRNIRIPVLAMGGSKDVMVNPRLHLDGWSRYLPEGADLTVREFDGLNHLFLPSETGRPDEYRKINAPVSPEALGVMATWILEKCR